MTDCFPALCGGETHTKHTEIYFIFSKATPLLDETINREGLSREQAPKPPTVSTSVESIYSCLFY